MIKIGERVECIDTKCSRFGEKGTFLGWVANAFEVEFDDGGTGLFLACDLRKVL